MVQALVLGLGPLPVRRGQVPDSLPRGIQLLGRGPRSGLRQQCSLGREEGCPRWGHGWQQMGGGSGPADPSSIPQAGLMGSDHASEPCSGDVGLATAGVQRDVTAPEAASVHSPLLK